MTLPSRISVFLQGTVAENQALTDNWMKQWQPERRMWLATSQNKLDKDILSQQQAQQMLGREFDVVVFDATDRFNADALGVAVGTIRAGGVLILWLPQQIKSLWLQRFLLLAQQFTRDSAFAFFWQSSNALPNIDYLPLNKTTVDIQLTADQQQALTAILRVTRGHRRRPLLLSADRGRGKSAVLGVAAAKLLEQGKKRIIITAPSQSAVQTLFKHASVSLPEAQSSPTSIHLDQAEIVFVAADRLLKDKLLADLLIVDEAAAFAQPMLREMLSNYSRIVFASTLHGYEGTGRGFKLQFQRLLDRQSPGWQQLELEQPVRWARADPLEQFSFSALLLDAELEKTIVTPKLPLSAFSFNLIKAEDLLSDETLLRQLFALLTQAHYRTRPSDCQAIMDNPAMSIYLLSYQGQVLAALWLNREGPLSEHFALQVHRGERRLKGELLPQALLSHGGLLKAASFQYQRIVRIAVHPDFRRQGLGSFLLQQTTRTLTAETELIGCSFSASSQLVDFWLSNRFTPVRLGLHADTVSSGHALVMLKPMTTQADSMVDALQQRFTAQWPVLLRHYFQHLHTQLILQLTASLPFLRSELSTSDQLDIEAFAKQQRALEYSFVPLVFFIWQRLIDGDLARLEPLKQDLLIGLFIQQRTNDQIIDQQQLTGHKQLLFYCRQAVSDLLLL